jgi:uncharacterized protein
MQYPITAIHLFSCEDDQYVFDGNSMLVARISKPLSDALYLCEGLGEEEALRLLTEQFGHAKTVSLLASLETLLKSGFFASTSTDFETNCIESKDRAWRDPVFATLEMVLTGRCNLRCTYCYADHGEFHGAVKLPYIPETTAAKALDLFLSHANGQASVLLLGGEPLLHPRFIDLLEIIRRKSENARVQTRISVTTNGTIYSEELAQALARHQVQVSFSVDGPQILHDRQRPFVNGAGSYDLVIANFEKMLAALGPENLSMRVTDLTGVFCTR